MLSKSKKAFQLFLLSAILSVLLFYLTFDFRLTVIDDIIHGPQTLPPTTTTTEMAAPTPTSVNLNATTQVKVYPRGHYIRVGNLDVALVTAVHYQHFPAKNGFNVFLNGWAKFKSNMKFRCCFLNRLNSTNMELVDTMSALYHIYTQWKVDMQNAEFSCSISQQQLQKFNLTQSSLQYVSFAENNCENATNTALRIEFRKTVPISVGICLKISYGYLDPELVIEWFEYQRLMGVTKVYSFLSEDLDPSTRKIFEYYKSIGFAETDPIHPAPSRNGTRRGFAKPRWEQQSWVDEVMAINDCKHRMAGLDFVLVHDMDEFIVPKSAKDNIYTILKKTANLFPKAAAFSFDSHVAMLNWGPARDSPMHIMKYTNLTTFTNFDGADRNTRWAFVSDRTFFGQNNKAWPKMNFGAVRVDNNLYTLIHRRLCKDSWTTCNNTDIRRQDFTLERYETRLHQSISKLPLKDLLGPDSTEYIKQISGWKPATKRRR